MAPSKKREKDAAVTTANCGAGGVSTVSGVATANNITSACPSTTPPNMVPDTAKLNSHHHEQELFLQAFEKPTQIYRFLRNRHGTSPIFLNRTLSYMKDRMSRNNKKRAAFKVDSILDSITQKSESLSNNYLNIIYNGLFDNKSAESEQWWQSGEVVCVESTLYKIIKSKRKDSTSDFQEVLTNNTNVIYNPHENIDKYSAVSIPVISLRPLGDPHTILKLLFRITITPKYSLASICDNTNLDDVDRKRSKICTKTYGCEIIVFEKNVGCVAQGDYEAALQEFNSNSIKSFSPKKRTWETLPDNYIPISMKFDIFSQLPILKFRVIWSASEVPIHIDAKDLTKYSGFADIFVASYASNAEACLSTGCEAQINHNNNCIKRENTSKREKIQIIYNFLYSNNTRQQTEYTQEVICPWCGLDCLRLYSLLKHLNLCHARFNFIYQPAGHGARIDVTINDTYDGSYAGSPYDLAGPSGCSFARTCGPIRRTSVTNLLVCRPRRQKTCLEEFLVMDEDDLSNQRPYITGHNRLYHHTETCLPVHPKELDIDSEGESDPLWLRQKTIQMIDEFSDVNEGEKELMKLWNLHVMKHGYVGDCQLPLACEMFLNTNGLEIIRKNLYRNFILHMCSLFDYGLVSPDTVYKTVQKLQGILSKYAEGQEMMSKKREQQLKYWLDVGMHKEDEQKLKSPQKQALTSSTLPAVMSDAASTAGGSATVLNENKSLMHPPLKRTVTAVKRAHLTNSLSAVEKLVFGSNAANSKPAAKKTVTPDQGARERRSDSSLKRANVGDTMLQKDKGDSTLDKQVTSAAITTDGRAPPVKRKILAKDVTPLAAKRNRSDSQNAAHGSSILITTRASGSHNNSKQQQEGKNIGNSNASSTLATTLPRRLITRRQSIACTSNRSLEAHHSSRLEHKTLAISGNNKVNNSTHSLRTRLSVPLTKVEKR